MPGEKGDRGRVEKRTRVGIEKEPESEEGVALKYS